MSAGYAEIAITSVLNSEKSFCKFLSANDTGATGAHQSGILISKTAMEMLFSREQLEQEGIPKRTVKIKWQNDFETESCFTYYASKNELRITKDFATEQAGITKLGENHVFYLPYLMGERSPHNNPDARAMFIGMSMDTTREDMTQAVLEGVAFGLRDSLEVARSLGIKIERTKICGGGAKSPLWKKMIANIMNLKVDVVENEEGPALGGAMLAAVGCGEYPDVETAAAKIVKVVDTVGPDEELTAKYEERYQQFRKLYPTVKCLYEKG